MNKETVEELLYEIKRRSIDSGSTKRLKALAMESNEIISKTKFFSEETENLSIVLNGEIKNLYQDELGGFITFNESHIRRNSWFSRYLSFLDNLMVELRHEKSNVVDKGIKPSDVKDKAESPVKERGLRTRNIVFVYTNPINTEDIRASEELKVIFRQKDNNQKEGISDNYRIVPLPAAEEEELARHIIKNEPYILHISVHANGKEGLKLQNRSQMPVMISPERLKTIVERQDRLGKRINTIIFNGCKTAEVAQILEGYAEHVIYTKGLIDDNWAMDFTRGFYSLYFLLEDVQESYKEGVSVVKNLNKTEAYFTI